MSEQKFSRTVVLLFSTDEEHGALGVRSYLDQLSPEQLRSIKYVINIDMIGYDADLDRVMELWSGDPPPSLNLTKMMPGTMDAYQIDLIAGLVVGCN